jgi:hypothetical protein
LTIADDEQVIAGSGDNGLSFYFCEDGERKSIIKKLKDNRCQSGLRVRGKELALKTEDIINDLLKRYEHGR